MLHDVVHQSASLDQEPFLRTLLCSGTAAGKLEGLTTARLLDLLNRQHTLAITVQHELLTCLSLVDTMFKDASKDVLKPGILQKSGRLAAEALQTIARAFEPVLQFGGPRRNRIIVYAKSGPCDKT